MVAISSADVFSRLSLLTDLDGDSAQALAPYCEDAANVILQNERDNCGDEAAGTLLSAAAALAFYRLALARDGCREGSWETGDVKIARNPAGVSAARGLWREALAGAAPYLRDSRFFFRGTPA